MGHAMRMCMTFSRLWRVNIFRYDLASAVYTASRDSSADTHRTLSSPLNQSEVAWLRGCAPHCFGTPPRRAFPLAPGHSSCPFWRVAPLSPARAPFHHRVSVVCCLLSSHTYDRQVINTLACYRQSSTATHDYPSDEPRHSLALQLHGIAISSLGRATYGEPSQRGGLGV